MEVEINQDVVDREGVPRALRDRFWWFGSDAGRLGTTAQIGLPANEGIVDVANDLVLSVRDNESELVIRAFDTGEVVRVVEGALPIHHARLVGRRVFWTGMLRSIRCEEETDGGVWTIDLDSARDPLQVVQPGRMDCGMGGRSLALSPTGDTLVSRMTNSPYWIDVIDVASLSHRARIRGVWPMAATDDTFIQDDSPPSDGQTGGETMTAYALGSGNARWSFPDPDHVDHFGLSWSWAMGSQFFVEYYWQRARGDADLVLATFDPQTGKQRELLRQHDGNEDGDLAELNGQLSTASHLSLEFSFRWDRAEARSFSVLDVASGEMTWDAYVIDPPWLCHYRDCYRDG